MRKSTPAAAAIRGSPGVLNSKTMLPRGTPPSRRMRLTALSLIGLPSWTVRAPVPARDALELPPEPLVLEDRPVHHRAGHPSRGDVEDAPACAHSVQVEALVGPADRVRGEDHLLEGQ